MEKTGNMIMIFYVAAGDWNSFTYSLLFRCRMPLEIINQPPDPEAQKKQLNTFKYPFLKYQALITFI